MSTDYSLKNPILFFPVRLETKFLTPTTTRITKSVKLRVRIYPDSISMRQDSAYFTEEEIGFGKEYWCTAYCIGENSSSALESGFKELTRRLGVARATDLVKKLKGSGTAWLSDSRYWKEWKVFCNEVSIFNELLDELLLKPAIINSRKKKILDLVNLVTSADQPPVVLSGFLQDQLTHYENVKLLFISGLKQKLKRGRQIVSRQRDESSGLLNELTRNEQQLFIGLNDSDKEDCLKVYTLICELINSFKKMTEAGRFMPENDFPYKFKRVAAKEENWFQKVIIDTLPDNFTVVCLDKSGKEILSKTGSRVTITEADLNTVIPKENEEIPKKDSILKPSWMTDYNIAVRSGMAVTLDISKVLLKKYGGAIPKIVVLGTSQSGSKRDVIQNLIDGHGATVDNMGFVSPGTPTNNTKSVKTGISDGDTNVSKVFKDIIEPIVFNKVKPVPEKGSDQDIFERTLNLEAGTCNNFANNSNTTILNAQCMNSALFDSNIGSMLFDFWGTIENRAVSKAVEDFYSNFVLARGSVPSIRIDRQPYGILQTTSWSNFDPETCCTNDKEKGVIKKSFTAINTIYKDFQSIASGNVSSKEDVDKGKDSHKAYLNMLGNNPVSQKFNYRGSINSGNRIDTEPFKWAVKELVNFQEDESLNANQLAAKFFKIFDLKSLVHTLRNKRNYKTVSLRNRLEYMISKSRALNLRYLNEVESYDGNVISHDEAKNALGMSDENNYINWLIDNFEKPDKIMNIPGFSKTNDKEYRLPPKRVVKSSGPIAGNLLFFMLRQSLMLKYKKEALTVLMDLGYIFDKRVNYYDSKLIYSDYSGSWGVLFDTIDNFVRTSKVTVDSRLKNQKLYNILSNDKLFDDIDCIKEARKRIDEYKSYLEKLSTCSIPELRNLFAEQLDLSTYRIDAWMLGFVNKKMSTLMESKSYKVQVANYGYLENVKHQPRKKLNMIPMEFKSILGTGTGRRIRSNALNVYSSRNDEIIHAPSLDHAAAAGVLKSAYNKHKLSGSDLNNPFSINLNSARIRKALALVENIRSGQDISTYLGYRIERYLHDSSTEMDWCIYELRKLFPTADSVNKADKISDAEKELSVVNGLDIVNTYRSYPFEAESLPGWAVPMMKGKLSKCKEELVKAIKDLVDIVDAVSDLTVTESVYHIVKGNHVQAATVVNAIGEGRPLPEVEFTKTPVNGTPVHHKTVLHLPIEQSGQNKWSEQDSMLYLLNPQLNSWITTLLPDPSTIDVSYTVITEAEKSNHVTNLDILGIEAIDLVFNSGSSSDLVNFIQKTVENITVNGDSKDKIVVDTKPERSGSSISVFSLEFLLNSIKKAIKNGKSLSEETFDISDEDGSRNLFVNTDELDNRINSFVNQYIQLNGDTDKIRGLKDKYDDASDSMKLEKAEELVNSIYNGEVTIVPVYNSGNEAPYSLSSFDNIPDTSVGQLKLDSWLSSISKVRKNMKTLSNISTMTSCLDIPFGQISPVQYPKLDNWLGSDFTVPLTEDQEGGAYTSFNILNKNFADNSSDMCGLVLDEWVEVLPVAEHTTAIAINTDQPDAVAPQSLLLAVPPHNKRDNWDINELVDVVTGTIDMSKTRLVEPQHLNGTIYSQVLPGVNLEMEADNKSNLKKGKVSFADISSSKVSADYDQLLSEVLGADSVK